MNVNIRSILKFLKWEIFGVEETWETFSQSIDGKFLEGGLFRSRAVEAIQGKWKIRLDTFSVTKGWGPNTRMTTTYTRIRSPILAQNRFRFSIQRIGFFNPIVTYLAMVVLKTGIPEFDKEFLIKGSNSEWITDLISNPNIRFLIESQIRVGYKSFFGLAVVDSWGDGDAQWVDGDAQVDLFFQEKGVIEDIERLKAIFDMFYQTLDHLKRAGGYE